MRDLRDREVAVDASARASAGSAWRSCAGRAAPAPRRARGAGRRRTGAARPRPRLPSSPRSTPSWISACVPTTIWAPARSRLDRAGEERDPHAELRAPRLDRQEVLLGQRLGRRHQRAREAGLDRAQQRVERDDGLAGADVALEQPLHRRLAGQVAVDLGDRLLLVGRQLEREQLAGSARPDRPARRAPRASLLAAGRARARGRPGARAARRTPAAAAPPPPPRASAADAARPARPRAAAAASAAFSSAGSGSGTSRACVERALDERRGAASA